MAFKAKHKPTGWFLDTKSSLFSTSDKGSIFENLTIEDVEKICNRRGLVWKKEDWVILDVDNPEASTEKYIPPFIKPLVVRVGQIISEQGEKDFEIDDFTRSELVRLHKSYQ